MPDLPMRLRYASLLVLLAPLAAAAQTPGDCVLGRAEADLDIADVHARVFNTGSLFYGNGHEHFYYVPKHTRRSPMYAAGIWVGGLVGGELRMAGATYVNFEFWPGPLDPATARPPNPDDCSGYDRIWRVSRHDVAEYYRTGVATDDLREWPAHLGAPVLDGDGIPDNYDLAAGDQPAISGDQMAWWVMNDVGNVHQRTRTAAIGLEVRVSAFAVADGPAALRQATFYRYTLVNRNAQPLTEARFGVFFDPDLGDAGDDYVGSDTTHGLAFVYNADDQDGNGTPPTYGPAPPAAGFDFLSDGLGAFLTFCGCSGPIGDPLIGPEMYHTLQGRLTDGSPMRANADGYGQPSEFPITTFMFPGDPVIPAHWSERRPSLSWPGPNAAGDRRGLAATPAFDLQPGEARTVEFALVAGFGTDHLDSVTELRRASTIAQSAYDHGHLDARRVPGFAGPPPPPTAVEVHRPAPNPFTDVATLRYVLPAPARVRIAVLDVLGRELAVLADGPSEAGAHEAVLDGTALAPGVYAVRVWVNGAPAATLRVTRR